MYLANVDGVRSDPRPGMKGRCPACDRDVVAKCGRQRIWHWAHSTIRHCDSWWEHETEWHRNWKSLFPRELQEIVAFDPITGEKHIADVKTARGMVIEFQNSQMSIDELRTRETFYGHMVWIVNARDFAASFRLGSRLPNPKASFLRDIVLHPNDRQSWYGAFSRKSENAPGSSMVELHSIRHILEEIEEHFVGHYLYDWKRKRTVWFGSSKPVFLDFGDENLWWLQIFDDRGLRCVKRIKKNDFISKNGGITPTAPWSDPVVFEEEGASRWKAPHN